MSKKVIIVAMAVFLVFVTQSQSHAEFQIYEISGILKDVAVDYNGSAFPGHAAFYLEKDKKTRTIILSDVPKAIAFERKMCVIRYADGSDGFYHFLSIEYAQVPENNSKWLWGKYDK